jgi:hypothetical protein
VRSYLADYRGLTAEDVRRAVAAHVAEAGDWSMIVLPRARTGRPRRSRRPLHRRRNDGGFPAGSFGTREATVPASILHAARSKGQMPANWNPLRLQPQPFFKDKNRAFWIMQSAGWGGYFLLRTLSGIANAFGWSFVLHTALLTATGYSVTLLMAAAFRKLIRAQPDRHLDRIDPDRRHRGRGFSVIEVSSHATFISPGTVPEGIKFLGSILLTTVLLIAWAALYTGINFLPAAGGADRQLQRLEHQASSAQLAMLRYQLNPHFLFNTLNSISTLVLLRQTERPMPCCRACRPSCATLWSTSRPAP